MQDCSISIANTLKSCTKPSKCSLFLGQSWIIPCLQYRVWPPLPASRKSYRINPEFQIWPSYFRKRRVNPSTPMPRCPTADKWIKVVLLFILFFLYFHSSFIKVCSSGPKWQQAAFEQVLMPYGSTRPQWVNPQPTGDKVYCGYHHSLSISLVWLSICLSIPWIFCHNVMQFKQYLQSRLLQLEGCGIHKCVCSYHLPECYSLESFYPLAFKGQGVLFLSTPVRLSVPLSVNFTLSAQ